MTILPKKKQNKSTNDDDRDKDHQTERYSYGQINSSGQNGQMSPNNRSWSSRNDDKRSAPESDCVSDHSNIGNSHLNLKRRHRVRERESNPDHQRSLISSVRSKSSINSPTSSPRELNNAEIELAIPGCSGIIDRKDSGELNRVPLKLDNLSDEENKKDISGYNSGDEYHQPNEHRNNIDWEEKERVFERKLRKKGFVIKKMCEDGACLFRAVADQVYGDQDMHSTLRKLCMDYMEKNCDYFSEYVTENFAQYIERKRSDHIHGNHIEIQALSEMFNRPIQVYHYSMDPMNTFQGCQDQGATCEPIRISYHRNVHYNSVVNPFKATIGVGLGLPGFKPGLADKSLMEKAIRISEQHELEQAMLEDKIRATDWDATSEAIEEQIARESYLEWLRENELRCRKKSSATSTLTKFADDESTGNKSPPKSYSPRSCSKSPLQERIELRSPQRKSKDIVEEIKSIDPDVNFEETSSFIHQVPSSVFGLNCWGEGTDDDILARVLAQSQAEYIESLKNSSISNVTDDKSSTPSTSATTSDHFYSSLPSTSNYKHEPGDI